MILYVDFDGTIVNSVKRICDMYNEDYLMYPDFKKVNWTDVNTWEFEELFCADKDNILEYFNFPRFFNEELEYMDWAKILLRQLSTQHEIRVVSMGDWANLIGKYNWIKKNLPYAQFMGIDNAIYPNKGHLDLSDGILIDDNENNLCNTNAKYTICFGDVYTWNEKWTGTRCENWASVVKKISEIINTEGVC